MTVERLGWTLVHLASLGHLAHTPSRYAVASTGPTLVTRIRRVLGLPPTAETRRFRQLPRASGAAGLFVAAGLAVCLAATEQKPSPDGKPAVEGLGDAGGAAPSTVKRAPVVEDEEAAPQVDSYGDPLPAGAIARIGSIRLRHTDTVRHVAYSPDGKLVASAGPDGIRLWETLSGKPLRRWLGQCDHVAFSPGGEELACAGNSEIWILDVATGHEIRRFQVKDIRGVAYAPDGSFLAGWGGSYSTRKRVVVSSEGFARLFDPKTGKTLREFEGHQGRVFSASLSADSRTLATSSQDNTIRFWETATGRELRQTSILDDARLEQGKWLPHNVRAPLAFSPEGQMLAVAMPDFSIRLWAVPSGKELRRLNGHEDKIQSLAFSKDGRYLVSGGRDKKVRVWETQFGHTMAVHRYGGHTSWIECVAFSPDYQTVVSGSQDHTVRLFHLPSGEQLHRRIGKRQRIRGASLSPEGKWYATGGVNGVHVWETETGEFLGKTHPPETVNCVAFSPDGKLLASGSWERGICLWKVVERNGHLSLKEVRRMLDYDGPVLDIAFSPDGTKLMSGGGVPDGTVRLWDVASGRVLHRWKMLAKNVIFSSDGRYMAALGSDRAVCVGEVESGGIVRKLEDDQLGRMNVRSIAFLASGRLLLTAGAGSPVRIREGRLDPQQDPAGGTASAIRVWDVATMREIGQFRRDSLTLPTPADHTHPTCSVRREVHELAVSANGRILAAAEDDNRVLLYDVATGRELKQLEGHESRVTSLVFSDDGTRLITTCSDDLTALVWDMTFVLGGPAGEKAVPTDTDVDNGDVAVVAGRVVNFRGRPAIQPPLQRAASRAAE